MTDEDKIGQWVRRMQADRNYQQTKWHKVESMIQNAAITRCGRRLEQWTFTKIPGTFSSKQPNALHYKPDRPMEYEICAICWY